MQNKWVVILFWFCGTVGAQISEPLKNQPAKDSLAQLILSLEKVQNELRFFELQRAKSSNEITNFWADYNTYLEGYLLQVPDSNQREAFRKNLKGHLENVHKEEDYLFTYLNKLIIKKAEQLKEKESRLLDHIHNRVALLKGSHEITFRGQSYRMFFADTAEYRTFLVWKNPITNNRYSSIGKVLKCYADSSDILMALVANAGMYTPDGAPQGLYLENGVQLVPLDTAGRQGNLNFYLKPNGVFWLDKSGLAHIQTTEQFQANQRENMLLCPYFATQSGPMLVINGKIHPSFRYGSKNLNIRNGVGILRSDKIILSISNNPVNLYDFASLYKDVLGCHNALYLDGAISRMYQEDIYPQERGGNFGPMICVSKKVTKY
jgi:uncharacterized protein YigE (DUF2233 family)